MELRDLNAFTTLAEVLHFGQAAARQHVTQSALSKQIRRLEATLGGPLFERSASATRLTALGHALLGEAQEIVRRCEQLPHTAQGVLAGAQGTLRVGFGVATRILVPAAIARFRAERPAVQVELCDLSTHHQILALAEGRLDLGFCRLPAPKGWYAQPVLRAHFVAVLPAAYPDLAGIKSLLAYPLAILRRDKAPSFHDHLMNYLAQSGLRPGTLQYVGDFAAGIASAAAGIAWTIIPSSTTVDHPAVKTQPLLDPEASWLIGLVCPNPPATPQVQAFCEIIAELSEPA
ncbi:LysR family transcriptional regulator [Aeromonas simiae]|uniref:LysR family transcriptional regulator n=1 Tax=Aeromonas simiae TaxID=218936 RepID=A0A5J6WTI4_9GAMM|nr:LysR family transcriptional regulator [Aeromonas simiae]QFI54456.1 LysR family transcriptional regulator [Aeromonas simiae]